VYGLYFKNGLGKRGRSLFIRFIKFNTSVDSVDIKISKNVEMTFL